MAITVDYSTTPYTIEIPKSDLTLDSGTKYNLTVDTFWQLLRDYADSPESLPFPVIYTRIAATASTPSITEINADYYQLQFEDGTYSVNIINGNTNIRDVEVKNQVSVNTNNTTGFIDPTFLEVGIYNNVILVDPINGTVGTSFPIGTLTTPAKTLADAQTLGTTFGISHIKFLNDYTFSASDVLDDWTVSGVSSNAVTFTLTSGVSTENTVFQDASMNGVCGGYTIMERCEIFNVSGYHGWMSKCIFRIGTLTLPADPTKLALLLSCYSGVVTGQPQPRIDINGDGAGLIIRAWSGPVIIQNKTGNTSGICLDFISGKLTLDSTNTAGHWPIRGTVYVVNNIDPTSGATVEEQAIATSEESKEIWALMGLDPDNPASITRYTQTAGSIQVAITGNGDSQTTLTRQ